VRFRFYRWHCITSFAAWEEVILKKCTQRIEKYFTALSKFSECVGYSENLD
jgi:hypothetical protein